MGSRGFALAHFTFAKSSEVLDSENTINSVTFFGPPTKKNRWITSGENRCCDRGGWRVTVKCEATCKQRLKGANATDQVGVRTKIMGYCKDGLEALRDHAKISH